MTATYKDIKSDILSKITKGDLEPGSLIANEIDLAVAYGCARATVNRAMRELADDGFIERRRKAGSRVRVSPVRQARFEIPIVRNEIEEKGAIYRYALVHRNVEDAPDWLRARLKLPVGGKVLHLICMHYADGNPYQHENRWINLAALAEAEVADFAHVGPNEWLVSKVPFTTAEIGFSAGLADPPLSQFLTCAVGDPVFTVERSTWWEGQAITFVTLTHKPGHQMTTRY